MPALLRTWLDRLLPQTIFWRLAWLIAIALFISVGFAVSLFNYNRQQMIAIQVTEQVGEVLADLEGALDDLTPAERLDWLEINRRPYAPHLVSIDSPDAPPAAAPRSLQSRAIAAALKARLAGTGEVREQRQPKRQLWVQVNMLGQPWWLVIPLGRFRVDAGWTMGLSIAMFAFAALAVAALFAWRINRPLRELQAAANQLGRGERPTALPESGPLEVRDLSVSFNRMLADLDTNERERNVMLAGISHDLRTPLARLKLGIEMMRDDTLRDGMVEDVEDIERILGQFVDFVRGLGNEAAVECDPAELARGIVARYARTGQQLELRLDDELPIVSLRPLALRRALVNLVDNALRYGAPPWAVSVSMVQQQLCFTISDHGPGIAPAELQAARQPFHRLDAGRRADGGSGLGLAIVDRIALLHAGELRLSNHPDGGLIATLALPCRPHPADH